MLLSLFITLFLCVYCTEGRNCSGYDNPVVYCSGEYIGVPYCSYYKGDNTSKVIISAVHGGDLLPASIPNRDYGCLVNDTCIWTHHCGTKNKDNCESSTGKDIYTMDIAFLLRDQLQQLTGSKPHMIINQLHRSKLDPNREINEATFDNAHATTAYNEIHGFIQQARRSIDGTGIFIDIHGHDHSNNLTELGYLVSPHQLIHDKLSPENTSIRYLYSRLKAKLLFETILLGNQSIGKCLQDEGYCSIPSTNNNTVEFYKQYYYGRISYNLKTYGSMLGGKIDGVQVEIHRNCRKGTQSRIDYVNGLAKAFQKFMLVNNYYEN